MSKFITIEKTTDRDIIRSPQAPRVFQNISYFCTRMVGGFALALVIWISILTLVREGQNADNEKALILLFLSVSIFFATFFPRRLIVKFTRWFIFHKSVLVSTAIILFMSGLIARFSFLAFDYVPTSDPLQFFNNATSLSQTGSLMNPLYVAMYPFLYAYNLLLAHVFDLTGSGLFGIIVLNTIFDILSTYLIGNIVRLLTHSKKWQLFASITWWVNPYNIIFCALSQNYQHIQASRD